MADYTLSLEASRLFVSYEDTPALSIEDLRLDGRIFAVLGHNGAGKSTLLKTILGLLEPGDGELALRFTPEGGAPFQLFPERHMAFCPENGSVFADIPVESYVRLWCQVKKGDGNFYKREGSRYIELLNVEPLLRKLGRELSKGQRRRVQTAIGFLTQPLLFLFDEPFDGLDVQRSNELSTILAEEAKTRAIILSSHRMDVVERLADHVVVLKEGRVAAAGTTAEVCAGLCKQSFLLQNVVGIDDFAVKLRAQFPGLLVNRIGDQVTVTGPGVSAEELAATCRALNRTAVVSPLQPSLSDAMAYHLQQVRGL